MTYICLKTFSCAQLMGNKYNLQLEVIHGFVSLSFWRLKYDWFHSDCFESCDTGCILLEIIQAVLSLVGSGKMFVMVILNQTVFESFWFKPDQASEFSFVLYTNVMHFLYSWQVQEKGSHYFSGEVSTNGKEQVVDGFFGPFGGGVLGKCQESSFSFKVKFHLTTFSFRMFQTRNYIVMKGDSMDLETPAMEI